MTIAEGVDVWVARIYMDAVHIKHGVIVTVNERIGMCSVRWLRDGKRSDTTPWRLRAVTTEFSSSKEEAIDKLVRKCQLACQTSQDALRRTETRLQIAMAAWTETRGRPVETEA